jgi:predicted ATPase
MPRPRRAPELARTAVDSEDIYAVLNGVWVFELNRANYAAAREVAEEILARAQGRDDPEPRIVGHHTAGTTEVHIGAPSSARRHFEQATSLYETHRPTAYVYRYGVEIGAAAYAHAASCQWLLGHPNEALRLNDQMLAAVDRAKHAFTTLRALYWNAVLHQFRGEWSVVDKEAHQLIGAAEERAYAMGTATGRILQGAARAALGDGEFGIREMRDGLGAYWATGALLCRPYYLSLLAEALRSQGLVEEGLAVLTEAISLVEATGERYFEAEIHRLRGALLLAHGDVADEEIVAAYRRALEIAQVQQARSLELRASTSLARLWRNQGKRTEARDLLAPIYNWFTEGFDTPDLVDAKSLLDELQ